MQNHFTRFLLPLVLAACARAQPVFNVKEHGATGRKQDDARPALQKAIAAFGRAVVRE